MENPMVEHVAQAIYDAFGRQPEEDAKGRAMGRPYLSMEGGYAEDGEPFPEGLDRVNIDGHVDLTAVARAAIEAMREPTEAMRWRGFSVACDHENYFNATFHGGSTGHVDTYQAMIDAALSSGEQDE